MEKTELARRKVLQTAVAALCVETGYLNVERQALGALSEATQSFITELGRTARMYSELSSRTEPTVVDIQSALIDAGFDVNGLPEYSKRPQRRHLPRQPRSYPQPTPRVLQVGSKVNRPSNIPHYLPSLPDPHTYIKTPTFTSPTSDYKTVREKLAVEKRNSRKALSTLLSKTRPSKPIAGIVDPTGAFTVVINQAPTLPVYITALQPSAEEGMDSSNTNKTESLTDNSDNLPDSQQSRDSDDTGLFVTGSESNEGYENPFLKPAKRVKLTVLARPS